MLMRIKIGWKKWIFDKLFDIVCITLSSVLLSKVNFHDFSILKFF